ATDCGALDGVGTGAALDHRHARRRVRVRRRRQRSCDARPALWLGGAECRGRAGGGGVLGPDSSCPDLIRASLTLHKSLAKKMDHRVKPGDDDFSYCSPVSPLVRFLARSISVTAIKISARVFRSGASSI